MEITRPILWNIDKFTKASMYVLAALATAIFLYGVYRRWTVWKRGRATTSAPDVKAESTGKANDAGPTAAATVSDIDWGAAAKRLARHVVAQQRIARIPLAWISHMAIFYGMIVLFIGTVIVALEDYGVFGLVGISWTGRFYTSTSFLLDLFGLAFVVAIPIAMLRRAGLTRVRPSAKPIDAAILWLLLLIGVTGFIAEGLRIGFDFERFAFEKNVSFVGWILARMFERMGIVGEAVRPWHLANWWVHMVLVMVFIALVAYTKMLHFMMAPLNIALTPEPNTARFRPVDLDEVESTGKVGLAAIEDFTQQQLISFDACTQCRRCESACPAWNTGKPLSPMQVVLDIAANGMHQGSLHGDVISAETLWSCTTCGACVHNCPVLIDQMGTIVEMRRHLVGEGQVVGSTQSALRTIAARGNPWGLPPEERAAWANGMEVPTIAENPEPEVLFWVGCAGSYDRRNQQVSRSLAKILKAANVNFAILGKCESCTGDPARRLGDDFTFMGQAEQNVATLNDVKFTRIVTQCAHCYNTLKNEYPDYGGRYQVTHHTAYIQELIAAGKLPLDEANESSVVFHDPCYLSRHNDGSAAPREVLGTGLQLPIVEAEAHGRQTFCCGAGGGRMWMEEPIDQRVNFARFKQLTETGAKTIAVGCPFCMTMLDDASKQEDSGVAVQDVAELVAARLTTEA
ncbi:MAG: 4Fe-4S dicluster domain-containing protein [Pirellulales bacterium]|nr:4Fe-4S dicluster domain-containing protein [Pirellulales bacterium]